MNIDSFLAHHNLRQHPFDAEEARHDPIFEKLMGQSPVHPDFGKILGRLDHPSTSVVFGEKGSGKTAIRLTLAQRVREHNEKNPQQKTLVVGYDDLNPMLDRVVERLRGQRKFRKAADVEPLLQEVRLEDHQDAMLSLAITRLVSSLLGESRGDEAIKLPEQLDKTIKQMPRRLRVDLAALAAIYDQPDSGQRLSRWHRLRRKLRLGWTAPMIAARIAAIVATLFAITLGGIAYFAATPANWVVPAFGLAAVLSALLWAAVAEHAWSVGKLARRTAKEVPAVDRSPAELRATLGELSRADRQSVPWPEAGVGQRDARYQLTNRLIAAIAPLGYTGMIVLVDRVDEPTLITGHANRMRAVIWPMLDNKFLQQEGLGLKLLLPLELRHLLMRESPEFFQEARLDKQNLIERLSWSGAVLYDLCTARLQACREGENDQIHLTDLFEEDVTRDMLVDALESMHQPRDAFKFLYNVVQEHCRMLPNDVAKFRIPRLVLETVRRTQAQRVQELYRGLSPA